MVQGLARILRAIAHPPVRRMLAVCLAACLALSPLSSALALHHVDDVDAISALSAGIEDADAGQTSKQTSKQTSDHASLPAGDHDCHACAVALLHVPSSMSVILTPAAMVRTGMNLVDGHDPGAELRPPRA